MRLPSNRSVPPSFRPRSASARARRVAALAVLAFAAAGGIGCARAGDVVELDNRFSMNIARVPETYPAPKTPLTPAQREVLDKRGRPDFFRFWWRPDGEWITSSDLAGRPPHELAARMATIEKSWIYVVDGVEVRFTGETEWRETPISETLRLIRTYGDPTQKSPPALQDGRRVETWTWVDHGLQIRLIDGHEVGRSYFQPTGAGTIIK